MATNYRKQFQNIVSQTVEGQLEFFLKRYILVLGEKWSEVTALASKFEKYTEEKNDTQDLNVTEAADFLQKNGKTRTANERREELKDIDLDNNGRIAFLEYLLLHYKVLILTDYFKEKEMPNNIDLSKDGVGVTGVGEIIMDSLFGMAETDPEIERAIESLMQERKARDDNIDRLQNIIEDSSKSRVQRMKAQHEMHRIEREDTSQANAALLRLMAGRRKAEKKARIKRQKSAAILAEEQKAEEIKRKK